MTHGKHPTSETEQAETPKAEQTVHTQTSSELDDTQSKGDSKIQKQVRPMPERKWGSIISAMHDYATVQHDLAEELLTKSREATEKLVPYKKKPRSSGQTESGISLLENTPVEPAEPKQSEHLKELYRAGWIKNKK